VSKLNPPDFLSTYRIQLHKDFTFQQTRKLVPYFSKLGISHLYLSPVFESNAGSTHGYDALDPQMISQERGGEAELTKLLATVRESSLQGVILDIVTNHLACSWKNPYFWDVLKNGKKSAYWKTFDLKTSDPAIDPIVLPVLGKPCHAALLSNEIKLVRFRGEWAIQYFESYFPLNKISQKHLSGTKTKSLSSVPVKTLSQVLAQQYYSLQDWRSGSRAINYRRFFDVNELIALRMEDPQVFSWFHKRLFSLMNKHSEIHGLRIDHVDGLMRPDEYLKKLNRQTPNVWVEKILGEKENLPLEWPVLGSTGYEFSNIASRLFVHLPGLLFLHSHYINKIDGRWKRFHDCVYDSKKEILESHFSADLEYVTGLFYSISQKSRKFLKKFTQDELTEVIEEVTASLKVYRSYAKKKALRQSRWVEEALVEAEGRGVIKSISAFDWFRRVLLNPTSDAGDLDYAIKRWEQLSGPVMAKGLEDTALYRYCPLLSLNGVGGEPDWFGDGAQEYHSAQIEKLRTFPLSMSTTSTHDTKRSEDVRSRIHLLSEISKPWIHFFEELSQESDAQEKLPRRVRYFILETILGTWPMDGKISTEFIDRIKAYAVKASREAKSETSWSQVNPEFEALLHKYISRVLKPTSNKEKKSFVDLKKFAEKIAYFGAFNSLGLLTLKATSPGLADFYQGCEIWDLSLVDPDNRRAVDYKTRIKILRQLQSEHKQSPRQLLTRLTLGWRSGEIKLFLTWRMLVIRNRNPELILHGEYIPLKVEGKYAAFFVSYLRRYQDDWLWIIIPRFLSRVEQPNEVLLLDRLLGPDIRFSLPLEAPREWKNIFTNTIVDRQLAKLNQIFSGAPVAVLRGIQR
jgi:(1->4)-alpha-D-glucan 1-alpha-D-glucosylmutase